MPSRTGCTASGGSMGVARLGASASGAGGVRGAGVATGGVLLAVAILTAVAMTRGAGRARAAQDRGSSAGASRVNDGWQGGCGPGWTLLARVLLRASGR